MTAQLVQLDQAIEYRTIKAPISGRVFDSQLSTYSVVNADQTILKLVPENKLVANISISNSDIGFVKGGMPVSISVDSFPAGEFGYITGSLTSIGSDALRPSQVNPTFHFPATVTLKEQQVLVGDKQLNLQVV